MATAPKLPEPAGEARACEAGEGRLRARADWLAAEFLPHRAWLRGWVAKRFPGEADLDDIVQESFERILVAADPDEVLNPRAYLGRTAYGLLISRLRRRRIVQIDYHEDLGELGLVCAYPLPDAACIASEEWERAVSAYQTLPERVREVIRLRRVEGASQIETARAVGFSESAIEKDMRRGLRLVRAEIAGRESDEAIDRAIARHVAADARGDEKMGAEGPC